MSEENTKNNAENEEVSSNTSSQQSPDQGQPTKENEDDIVLENDSSLEPEQGTGGFSVDDSGITDDAEAKIKKLKEKLKQCEKEKGEYLDGWQRTKAELVNARKEDEKRMADFVKYAEQSLLNELLPLADNFERAFSEQSWKDVDKTWQDGIKYLYDQLIKILKEHNLEQINAEGQKFNPEEHEAVEEIEVDDESKDGIVIESSRCGYRINDKIIRPAQVKVGKRK
jgi:molecular chaperone GrpE